MSKKNLICICLDTFRYDILSGKLSPIVKTPNMDKFLSESIVFEKAFGEGQPTLQMRRSAFTGERTFPWNYNCDRRGHWHHAAGWQKIPPYQDTMAEILLANGYLTGLIADTNHMFKPTMNYTRGFVTYEFIRGQEGDNYRSGRLESIEARAAKHAVEPIDWGKHMTLAQYMFNTAGREGKEDYSCAKVFRTACRWLQDNSENAPFFLWVDSFDPHEPWDPPKEYADMYMPDYKGKDFIFAGAAYDHDRVPTDEELERIKALYFGEVTFVDEYVGVLLKEIDYLGLRDNTIVMLVSDHGTQLMEHGRFGKGAHSLRAYNTQINWVVRHPDYDGGRKIQGFVQSHDILPTALGLLDIPVEVSGCDIWPLVDGQVDKVRDHVVIGWAGSTEGNAVGRVSVRDEEWNYVVSVGGEEDKNPELYHLTEDPGEDNNVVDKYPEVVRKQRKRIEAVIKQPLPGKFIEVCDLARSPFIEYLMKRRK